MLSFHPLAPHCTALHRTSPHTYTHTHSLALAHAHAPAHVYSVPHRSEAPSSSRAQRKLSTHSTRSKCNEIQEAVACLTADHRIQSLSRCRCRITLTHSAPSNYAHFFKPHVSRLDVGTAHSVDHCCGRFWLGYLDACTHPVQCVRCASAHLLRCAIPASELAIPRTAPHAPWRPPHSSTPSTDRSFTSWSSSSTCSLLCVKPAFLQHRPALL